jgi:cholesterol oxidase
MADHFDAVVVGSGFGGSVVAYRLAEAGKSVCVLERGRPYPPGSFPRSPRDLSRNLWDPTAGLYGMFDVWSFRGIEALVSSGLGGGSLIYANVLIRKDPDWFVDQSRGQPGNESWPITYEDLEDHYEACERMLGATPYPFDHPPYDSTAKTKAMQEAARRLGLDWRLPNLAVTFARPGQPPYPGECITEEQPNLHGRQRLTCCLCGECDIGCNYGSKNSLDYNYLSRAQDLGADIRSLAEVRTIEPEVEPGRGYRVTYVRHDPDHDRPGTAKSSLPHTTVTADRLVLGAGAFGSTYLLLRNRSAFPRLSSALGTRFSGNGDLLTFLRRAHRTEDGRRVPRWLDPAFGPVITSAIRMGDALDGGGQTGRGFYLEDGGNPQFLSWLVEATGAAHTAARLAGFAARRGWARLRGNPRSNLSADVAALLGRGERSGTALPMLAMGRDVPDGVMRLRDGNLDLDWTMRTSQEYFSRVHQTLRQVAGALGARLTTTPLWLFRRVITVHPLGGCPMGADEQHGVVDQYGEVFNYPGFHVVDGSVMPGPVGPNPALTIAAFADRAASAMLGERPAPAVRTARS